MHLNLANEVLSVLHQFAEESGYSSYASAKKIGEYLGVTDREKLSNTVKLLETRGLVRVIWLRDPQLCLSEEGALFLESGNGLADHASPGGVVTVDQSTHFHGPITGSAVNVRSTGGTQSISTGANPEAIIGMIIDHLSSDNTIPVTERDDYIIDAENLGRELKKNKPNQSAVSSYLTNLGSVASIAGLVASLVSLL
ncbi:hypothetical protein ACSV5M_20260 [Cellvibrio sp. ARAG 10.3]|uniref:hypothetical protein n=1 Tax=Cellvibrio sp. ARAG 10.3 TaxID=3451358 RepID=UPI003F470194